eukprot:759031-Hanusia_phi.AAC.2
MKTYGRTGRGESESCLSAYLTDNLVVSAALQVEDGVQLFCWKDAGHHDIVLPVRRSAQEQNS